MDNWPATLGKLLHNLSWTNKISEKGSVMPHCDGNELYMYVILETPLSLSFKCEIALCFLIAMVFKVTSLPFLPWPSGGNRLEFTSKYLTYSVMALCIPNL